MDAKRLRQRQKVNGCTAKFVPLFLTGFVAYASYVVVGPLTVDYLLKEQSNGETPHNVAVGIAVPIVYFVLMIFMAAAYFRLLWVVFGNPGYVPEGDRPPDSEEFGDDEHVSTIRCCARTTVAEKTPSSGSSTDPWLLDYEGILQHHSQPPAGLEEFYNKDVFVCDGNGLPLWCGICCNWKPDRSHHCSDIGRCVMKMDHFCPWVGGVVGENSYKFFAQFLFYTAVYTAYTLILFAYFVADNVAERQAQTLPEREARRIPLHIHWIVALGLAGFFCLFSMGMVTMTTQMTFQNVTTIENIDAAKRSMFLAVALPPQLQGQPIPPPPGAVTRMNTPPSRSGDSGERPFTSEIDDPAHASYFSSERTRTRRTRSSSPQQMLDAYEQRDVYSPYGPPSIFQGTITYPLYLPRDRPPLPAPQPRTFAILRTPPGTNPWDLGSWENFTSVFGRNLHDWMLPVRHSPCRNHSSEVSTYGMGWQFQELLYDAGLTQQANDFAQELPERERTRPRKRVRRLSEGWQNGERPNGWITEKEVRRVRNEHRWREGQAKNEQRWREDQSRVSR